ncbi:MAG TPA: rhamnan synthesis F family protein [Xanthobacteraceae bacterium]|nr:rhamnan synthesis F family protein [Xanthobacteraceae bacterium]
MAGTDSKWPATLRGRSHGTATDVLRACISPASFWAPARIGPQPAWIEHAPFAFWLVDALRPRMLVELGTHGGFSYFTFCEAVEHCRLSTRCFAIDTWTGDEHAGFYGEEVFAEVKSYNDGRFAGFSTLIRLRFDDAVEHFFDGTIDLLHIDGRHLYEDVKNDFETWRAKLSRQAVVLFHDSNVRERNFGVHRLWEDLRHAYPHFEFLHGHGLAVLGAGVDLPSPIRTLFAADATASAQIRNIYSRLGAAIAADFHRQQSADMGNHASPLASHEAEVARLQSGLAEVGAPAAALTLARTASELDLHTVAVSMIWRRAPLPRLGAAWSTLAGIARRILDVLSRHASTQVSDVDTVVTSVASAPARVICQRAADRDTLSADPVFDAAFYLPIDRTAATRDEAIAEHLNQWATWGTGRPPPAGDEFRRPCPGFHPQVYAHENAERFDPAVMNPLAHFIRNGKPNGPWRCELIVPAAGNFGDKTDMRAVLHAHIFYPELFDDLLRKLAANRSRCDLLLTTDTQAKAALLRASSARYQNGQVSIRLVPNRGRNLGPLLSALVADVAANYDFVGHIHSKRTHPPALGYRWREFLWQHLVGGEHAMIDAVLDRLAADPALGIVFPADPHLPAWDANRDVADRLAARMGFSDPLPPFFDFPVGTMFWARTRALRPLFALELDWDDYPPEPVARDGTILHAIERLLPFVARHAGYRFAETHVPGTNW